MLITQNSGATSLASVIEDQLPDVIVKCDRNRIYDKKRCGGIDQATVWSVIQRTDNVQIQNMRVPNMSGCCSSSGCDEKHPKKNRCPVNGLEYSVVTARTITHHIKESWNWAPSAKQYYFCDDPDCHVVYFGDDGSTIPKPMLRIRVGTMERTGNGMLCYCFSVSRADFERNPATRDFVMAQTKANLCSRETSNPSGRCCLKDFSKQGSESGFGQGI